ncbi:geranylgeranyl transferase type-2 subunit beta [Kwoniella mangroviensis CBS 10435]|uniref:Geranylgeranyl transferase type-2 subunit beta n=1 Tax=Kwoniella mangroviensis CBS 10435 TaxID=1331196 RepID=A0A1B9J3D6_9TREE|nr:geranylgeranyl transferase type-2 subunit beta [Kwoniella mangroviensis CBS 10435]
MAAASSSSSSSSVSKLDVPLHIKYIQNLDKRQDLAYHLTSHLRLNGIYWGLTASHIMGQPSALDREGVIEYVLSCWDEEAGAFGPHPNHDGHILATLSGIQIMLMEDAIDRVDVDNITKFLLDRINPDGSVSGDSWGEIDTRFTYILLSSLSLLGRLDRIPKDKRENIVEYISRCRNFDGGFGRLPGAESHSGQVWVCTAALSILDRQDLIDIPLLGAWLSERQLPNGGLNGRPEKLEDVCYSWWCLASISILGKLNWINKDKLINFILGAQDLEDGGIADRPGDWVDVFHTLFGVAGLSLLGYPGLENIDPVYCMPAKLIDKLGLTKPYATLPRMQSYP